MDVGGWPACRAFAHVVLTAAIASAAAGVSAAAGDDLAVGDPFLLLSFPSAAADAPAFAIVQRALP